MIPDQKNVLNPTLKSEFSKKLFCTLISILNTFKEISLTKSIDKSGHSLGDSFLFFEFTYFRVQFFHIFQFEFFEYLDFFKFSNLDLKSEFCLDPVQTRILFRSVQEKIQI